MKPTSGYCLYAVITAIANPRLTSMYRSTLPPALCLLELKGHYTVLVFLSVLRFFFPESFQNVSLSAFPLLIFPVLIFLLPPAESILFVHDALIRRMWTPHQKEKVSPIVTVTGSHIRKHVYLVHLPLTVNNYYLDCIKRLISILSFPILES